MREGELCWCTVVGDEIPTHVGSKTAHFMRHRRNKN